MLGARRPEHVGALPVEEHDRSQVHLELEVDVLRLLLGHGRSDANAGVVDEHVESAEALAMARDHGADGLLVGHVRRCMLDLVALGAQRVGRLLEPVWSPRADRKRVPLLRQGLGDREAYPSRGSSDDGGGIGHWRAFQIQGRMARKPTGGERFRASKTDPLGGAIAPGAA
jgi:hypothetical protein